MSENTKDLLLFIAGILVAVSVTIMWITIGAIL